MKILYAFPHPDDESYGPGLAIARQRREGHEVHLLTLTKGGATKERRKFDLSVEEMGDVRRKEMQNVRRELDLTSMTVLDLPDSELKELDPEAIERPVREHIERSDPDIVITYALHGISDYDDHLVMHAAVKGVFCDLRRNGATRPRRLAFFCIREDARHDDKANGLRP